MAKAPASITPDLDPKTAMVLLWYYNEVPKRSIPAWVLAHPAWPKEGTHAHLVAAARPMIEALEREVAGHG